jgi:hypothetical protein
MQSFLYAHFLCFTNVIVKLAYTTNIKIYKVKNCVAIVIFKYLGLPYQNMFNNEVYIF